MTRPRPFCRVARVGAGALCAGQGLQLLFQLLASASAARVVHVDWLRWWAAVLQWDAGVLVLVGFLVRPAAVLGCVALAYSALTTSPDLPSLLAKTTFSNALALTTVLSLLVTAFFGPRPGRPQLDHADAPTPRPRSDRPRSSMSALNRTEPLS